jgi:hypothetical protein
MTDNIMGCQFTVLQSFAALVIYFVGELRNSMAQRCQVAMITSSLLTDLCTSVISLRIVIVVGSWLIKALLH